MDATPDQHAAPPDLRRTLANLAGQATLDAAVVDAAIAGIELMFREGLLNDMDGLEHALLEAATERQEPPGAPKLHGLKKAAPLVTLLATIGTPSAETTPNPWALSIASRLVRLGFCTDAALVASNGDAIYKACSSLCRWLKHGTPNGVLEIAVRERLSRNIDELLKQLKAALRTVKERGSLRPKDFRDFDDIERGLAYMAGERSFFVRPYLRSTRRPAAKPDNEVWVAPPPVTQELELANVVRMEDILCTSEAPPERQRILDFDAIPSSPSIDDEDPMMAGAAAAALDTVTASPPTDPPAAKPAKASPPLPTGATKAMRAKAQYLSTFDKRFLRPLEFIALDQALMGERSRIAAMVAAALYGGLFKAPMSEWGFADTLDDIDTQRHQVWVVRHPPCFVVAVAESGARPPAPAKGGAPAPATVSVFLPLHDELPWIHPLLNASNLEASEALDAFFDRIAERGDPRLSASRLRGVLPALLHHATGDDLLGSTLSGGPPNPATGGRGSYVGYTLQHIRDRWWRALQGLAQSLSEGSALPLLTLAPGIQAPALPLPLATHRRIGSQRVPDLDRWKDFVCRLAAAVPVPSPGAPSRRKVVALHNALVIYTLGMLLCATGVRPSRKGLARLCCPDDVLHIEDKNTRDGAKIRLLRLPPTAATQVAHLRGHFDWWNRRRNPGRVVEGWFLLDEDERPQPIRREQLQPLFDHGFAANANRHLLCTRLREIGMDAQRINLVMGHQILGEEIGDRWSAASPLQSDDEVATIEGLLKEQDWHPKVGMGRE